MKKLNIIYGFVIILVVTGAGCGARAADMSSDTPDLHSSSSTPTYAGNAAASGGSNSAVASSPSTSSGSEATDNPRLTITEENDKFASGDDRHYTQGARVGWLTTRVTPYEIANSPYMWMGSILPIFQGGDFKRKLDWTPVGQSLFTPTNTQAVNPGPQARPYGAWLYTGVSMLQSSSHETHDTLENFEILGGVVGPIAFGNVTQNDFHQLIGDSPSRGWQNQIHNEPGLVVTYERKWRFGLPFGESSFGADAIPEIGATGGNIFTYGETGGMLRIGQNLNADFGSSHIRPSLSGTDWFDKDRMKGPTGWYLFVGTQGRAIARNIFLDGNTFRDSVSVDKKPLVADFVGGASVFWTDAVKVDFTVTQRTKEFYTQQGHDDRFGSISFVFGF